MWTYLKPNCSLLEWSTLIGFNPYYVAQVGTPANLLANDVGQCENVFFQTAAQRNDHLSREDIAQALLDAEQTLAEKALTYAAPTFEAYPVSYPRPSRLDYTQLWSGSTGRLKPVAYKYGNIITMGLPVDTLLQANVAITPADPYSDGFDTTFTATVAVAAGTLASELRVTFSAGDTPSDLQTEDMRIYPLTITISGLVATIQGYMTQVILVENYRKRVPVALDATDAAIYATTIDVYRRTYDLNQSGTLYWDNMDGCPEPPCTYSLSNACFYATDPPLGYVTPVPGSFDSVTDEYERVYSGHWRAPDRVSMNVTSGIPRASNGQVAKPWQAMIAYLATAMLPQQKSCGCDQADTILYFYRSMPIREDGTLEASQAVLDAASAEFGMEVNRGVLRAYQLLIKSETLRVYRGVSA